MKRENKPAGRSGRNWRIGIIHSSFHNEEVASLVAGARHHLAKAGVKSGNITEYPAHGSFEVPLIGAALAEARAVDALIGIGIIVEGETHHARLLAESVVQGMMDVQTRYRIPFAFEVLYVDSIELARERCRLPYNKGAEAAAAVLQTIATLATLERS
ncbi:MAG: 6,7-dimethyl-8-ribityllumazine synthase [Candidatus Peregrinibacteria bacterium Greene0416_19]|nr:MAG: 6,7-dimethyl-8-ribityllumazine synthase [Candidatus Peregrinibacteria bacterium Greene0416_19]